MKEKINIELDVKTKKKLINNAHKKKYVFERVYEAVY